jgi:branched-chain amino acid transport system ATP-binding protein
MDLKNNLNPTLRIAEKMDRLEKKMTYLASYLSVMEERLAQKRAKKMAKRKEAFRDELFSYEIRTLSHDQYVQAFIQPEIDKLEKNYKLKERAKKASFTRKLSRSNDASKTTLTDAFHQDIQLLHQELEEKKQALIRSINVLERSSQALNDAEKAYQAEKARVQSILDFEEKALKDQDEETLKREKARLDRMLQVMKTKLEALRLEHKNLLLAGQQELPEDIILRLQGLRMQFGGLVAVSDLSFDVKKGEIFGLIGPNGAGKTTVFNCITQFYKPTKGEIYYRDKRNDVINLNHYAVHDIIHQGIVRTFQNVELIWELSILDNLLVGAHSLYQTGFFHHLLKTRRFQREESVLRQKAIKVLTDLNLIAYKDFYPIGLPYGILKQVELARTLMSNPQLIILDEPAAGLNDLETDRLIQTIRKIQKEYKVTIFLVEHDMGLVMELCDTICAISFGKMLAIGTPKEIQSNPVVQEAYLGGE